jgi:hypothetical protein
MRDRRFGAEAPAPIGWNCANMRSSVTECGESLAAARRRHRDRAELRRRSRPTASLATEATLVRCMPPLHATHLRPGGAWRRQQTVARYLRPVDKEANATSICRRGCRIHRSACACLGRRHSNGNVSLEGIASATAFGTLTIVRSLIAIHERRTPPEGGCQCVKCGGERLAEDRRAVIDSRRQPVRQEECC